MALSVFDDKDHCPEKSEVERVVRGAAPAWRWLVARVSERFPSITEQWNFAGKSFGWSLRLKSKDRVVLYMTPQGGSFLVGIVLGEKAVEAAHAADLPEEVLTLIDAAPRYAEGRGMRITVTSEEEAAVAERLAAIKMSPQPTRRGSRGSARRIE